MILRSSQVFQVCLNDPACTKRVFTVCEKEFVPKIVFVVSSAMVERRRQLALWSRTAFWFVVLCVAVVVIPFEEEQEQGRQRFELDQNDGIFNASFENQLESGPVSPVFLREAVMMVQSGLKTLKSRTNTQWNATTSRFGWETVVSGS